MSYKLRFTTINSNDIYNYAGPGYGVHYCSKEERARQAQKHVDARNKRDGFFDKLEESILKDGFRNPLIIHAGFVYPSVWKNMPPYLTNQGMENVLMCMNWGGSRLWVAQKHNLDVSCVVLDFVNRFKNEPWLKTANEIRSAFTDKPTKIIMKEDRIFLEMDIHKWQDLSKSA